MLRATHQCKFIRKLGYRKVSSQCVPKQLTEEHKAMHMGLSLEHLLQYETTNRVFLIRIITADETCVHRHTRIESGLHDTSWHGNTPPPHTQNSSISEKELWQKSSRMHEISCWWTLSQGSRKSVQPITVVHWINWGKCSSEETMKEARWCEHALWQCDTIHRPTDPTVVPVVWVWGILAYHT
jgi:hypothetical protein